MERSKTKVKPMWRPQHFYVRYHYTKEKWMITDQCGHYIGLAGEIIDRPKFHRTASIATEYLLLYQRSPAGRAAHEAELKFEAYERAKLMEIQRAKDVARKEKADA